MESLELFSIHKNSPSFNEDFNEVFKIMEQSFPLDEFRPYKEQLQLFEKENYQILVYKMQNKIVAFCALWTFKTFNFLENFAVQKKIRNLGLGSRILKKIIEKSKEKFLVLEVEPPKFDCQNLLQPQAIENRRIEFYKRNGFIFNHFDYEQPSISKGRKPIPLKIMSYSTELSKNEFDEIKKNIHQVVYNKF